MAEGIFRGGDIFGWSYFKAKENRVFSMFSGGPSIATFKQATLKGIWGCSNSWLLIGRCSNQNCSVKERKRLWPTPLVPWGGWRPKVFDSLFRIPQINRSPPQTRLETNNQTLFPQSPFGKNADSKHRPIFKERIPLQNTFHFWRVVGDCRQMLPIETAVKLESVADLRTIEFYPRHRLFAEGNSHSYFRSSTDISHPTSKHSSSNS